MKVRCIETKPNNGLGRYTYIEKEVVYDVLREVGNFYYIINNMGDSMGYEKELFEVVRETMKIKNWTDLHQIKNDELILNVGNHSFGGDVIYINKKIDKNYQEIAKLYTEKVSKEKVVEWLKFWGFNVELVEPRKISKQLYHLAMAYPDWWFAVDEDGRLHLYDVKPSKGENQWIVGNKYVCKIVNSQIRPKELSFKDKPIQGKDLAKWEVEE